MQAAQTLSSWLLRSYIDLQPTPCQGILHPHGVDQALRVLTHGDAPPQLQAVLMPSFRSALLRKVGLAHHAVADPRRLPLAERSARWHLVCDYLAAIGALCTQDVLHVLQLLRKLCMYEGVLIYAPEVATPALSQDETWAQVAYLRAQATHVLQQDAGELPCEAAYARVAQHAPRGGAAQLGSLQQLCLHSVKHARDRGRLRHWMSQYETALEGLEDRVAPLTAALTRSRFHRMAAWGSYMDTHRSGVHAALNRAEACVHASRARTPEEELARQEALFPILEARTKEAQWLHDAALAQTRVRQLVDLCPLDARARLLCGEVLLAAGNVLGAMSEYRWATRLAPPGEEIAWFMLGQCHEVLGHADAAFDAYLHALSIDPGAVSATRRLRTLVKNLMPGGVGVWVKAQDELLQRAALLGRRSAAQSTPCQA